MQLPAHRTLVPIFDELRGERVLLRPYREGDAEALFEAIAESREHLLPWMPWSAQYQSLDDARHFVRLNASMWIARERLILDPGMGQFVGSDPENSLILLRRLPELKARYGLPVLVSVSRKGFLRKLVNRPAQEAGAASLAAELFAEANGADYIRTHAPGALRDGLKVLKTMGKDADKEGR